MELGFYHTDRFFEQKTFQIHGIIGPRAVGEKINKTIRGGNKSLFLIFENVFFLLARWLSVWPNVGSEVQSVT
jgi:hypothetical protein